MSLRNCYLALLAVAMACEMGCARGAWPCGKTWCGPDCGEFYWHEWFSHPPECCDPCDCCANFTGRPGQSPYTSAIGQQGQGQGPWSAESNYGEPYPQEGDGSPELAPAEELPMGEPNAAAFMNEFGDLVSYQEPVDSPPPSRKLGARRRDDTMAR